MVQIVLAALGRQYPNLLGKSENDWKLKNAKIFCKNKCILNTRSRLQRHKQVVACSILVCQTMFRLNSIEKLLLIIFNTFK